MTAPKAAIFDVFGTLVDWRRSVARHVTPFLAEHGGEIDPLDFADYWRSRYQPRMATIRSGSRGYVRLDQLHLENLDETLAHFGLAGQADEATRHALNRAWEHLDPWPDARAGLAAIRKHAFIAPCSNGSIALMTRLARHTGFEWDCILGADLAQNYKPEPEVYLTCCRALALAPDEVMMIACHNDDLVAARQAGLKTGFVPRPTEYGPGQTIDLAPSEEWDLVAKRLDEPNVAAFFARAASI